MAEPTEPRIFAVVLAAGMSRRFGSNKQLHKIDGVPMVRKVAALARAVCGNNTLLIVGYDHHCVTAAADGECQFIAINEDFADGIGSSIACAAKSLAFSADAMLILLADQPLINVEHLNDVLSAWSGDDEEIIATSFSGVQGPPVLLPRSLFPRLAKLSGDSGARDLLHDSQCRLSFVHFEPAAVDIDSPEDLKKLNQAASGRVQHSAHS